MAVLTAGKINVTRMTINSLDLDSGSPRFAESLFPVISQSETISNFFDTHFNDTRKGKYTKSCKFLTEYATVKTIVKNYLDNRTDEEFIRLSQKLTDLLFKIMQNTSSSSNGKYFILEISQDNDEEWLFLIKLDPRNAVQVNDETLTLEVLKDILPESSDKVHKCAIIRFNHSEDEEAELYVLDRQQKEGEPAKFFLTTYLQAEELLNDSIITSKAMLEAKIKIANIVPNVNKDALYLNIDREFQNGRRIDLLTSIKNVLDKSVAPNHPDRELFLEERTNEFVNEYLRKYPDHSTSFVVERKSNTISFKDDDGQFFLRFNSGIADKIEIDNDADGNTLIKVDKELNLTPNIR